MTSIPHRHGIRTTIVLFALLTTGCHEADRIVMPIVKTVDDLNCTANRVASEIPIKAIDPDAQLRFKGRKLMIEKRF